MRTCSALLAISLLVCLLGGCLGPVSLDEYKYVSSIGVDKGQTETYAFTFLLQSEASDSSSQSAAGKAILVGADGGGYIPRHYHGPYGGPLSAEFERLNSIVFAKDVAQEGRSPA